MIKELIFDETNPNWVDDPFYVECWMKHEQNYLNTLLNQRGYIYLNEIYENLAFNWDPEDDNLLFTKDTTDGIILTHLSIEGVGEDGNKHRKYLITITSYKTGLEP